MTVPDSIRGDVEQTLGQVPSWMDELPDGAAEGYWELAKKFWLAETKLPAKYKELIGLGVSAATRCRYCTLFHTEAAKVHGASEEEIAEASSMAGVTMFASTFINGQQVDHDAFRQETADIVAYVRRNMEKGKAARPAAPMRGR